MEEKKKVHTARQKLETIVSVLLVACILLVGASIVTQRSAGKTQLMLFGWGAAVVQTGSMEPTIPVGSLILIQEQDAYEVGDIVTYDSGGSRPVTHRIIAIDGDEVITQGDANNAEDRPFDRAQIIGEVVYHSLGAGRLLYSLQSPVALCGLVALIGLIWLLPYLNKRKVEE